MPTQPTLQSDEWNNGSFEQTITNLESELQGVKDEVENGWIK
jgi:hypothetical protein